jgi:hypothetical protein
MAYCNTTWTPRGLKMQNNTGFIWKTSITIWLQYKNISSYITRKGIGLFTVSEKLWTWVTVFYKKNLVKIWIEDFCVFRSPEKPTIRIRPIYNWDCRQCKNVKNTFLWYLKRMTFYHFFCSFTFDFMCSDNFKLRNKEITEIPFLNNNIQ